MKQFIINLDDNVAQKMQEYLEAFVFGMGLIKFSAKKGMTYEQFVDFSKATVCSEAEKKIGIISNEIAEVKENNISLTDYCSANFDVIKQFADEFTNNNTITFNCEEVTNNRPNASKETEELFYTRLFETIILFLDPRAKKALMVQQTQK